MGVSFSNRGRIVKIVAGSLSVSKVTVCGSPGVSTDGCTWTNKPARLSGIPSPWEHASACTSGGAAGGGEHSRREPQRQRASRRQPVRRRGVTSRSAAPMWLSMLFGFLRMPGTCLVPYSPVDRVPPLHRPLFRRLEIDGATICFWQRRNECGPCQVRMLFAEQGREFHSNLLLINARLWSLYLRARLQAYTARWFFCSFFVVWFVVCLVGLCCWCVFCLFFSFVVVVVLLC